MKKWIIALALFGLTLTQAWPSECIKIHTLVLLSDGRVMLVGGSEYDDLAKYLSSEVKGDIQGVTMSRGHGRIVIIERPIECTSE